MLFRSVSEPAELTQKYHKFKLANNVVRFAIFCGVANIQTWEVNTRLKLDEMEKEQKHGTMFPVSSGSNGNSPSIKPVRESLPSLHATPNQ